MTGDHPRRILMTADAVGGVWTYALELARALERWGVEVSLATMGGRLSEKRNAEARRIPNLEVFESSFKLEWMEDPWEDVQRAGEWLLELAARVQPEIIHLNGYAHAKLAWPLPTVVVGHSCVLSWWKAVKGEHAPESWNRYREEVRGGLEAASLIICPTRAMLRCLEEHYGGTEGRASIIPNARSPWLFQPGEKANFILTAGRLWDEAKNVRMLEVAAPGLRWPVFVAGEDRHPERQALNDKQAACRNVHRLGALPAEELARYYACASIYALPARYEPFGLSVLEAALAGCALVLGDIPSLRENWDGCAIFVQPDDAGGLRAAMNELIDNAERRTSLAALARERAARFSPKGMADAYLSAYRTARSENVRGRESLCAS